MYYLLNKKGFTMIEILTAIIIVTMLVALAVPLYEKTIERSRLAEARSMLMELQDGKLFSLTKLEMDNFDATHCRPTLSHLHVAHDSSTGISFDTKNFTYSLYPSGTANINGVCAIRNGGDYNGTIFYYYRPVGGSFVFQCKGTACSSVYGLDSTSGIICNKSC